MISLSLPLAFGRFFESYFVVSFGQCCWWRPWRWGIECWRGLGGVTSEAVRPPTSGTRGPRVRFLQYLEHTRLVGTWSCHARARPRSARGA